MAQEVRQLERLLELFEEDFDLIHAASEMLLPLSMPPLGRAARQCFQRDAGNNPPEAGAPRSSTCKPRFPPSVKGAPSLPAPARAAPLRQRLVRAAIRRRFQMRWESRFRRRMLKQCPHSRLPFVTLERPLQSRHQAQIIQHLCAQIEREPPPPSPSNRRSALALRRGCRASVPDPFQSGTVPVRACPHSGWFFLLPF